jgi:hypothetical protein
MWWNSVYQQAIRRRHRRPALVSFEFSSRFASISQVFTLVSLQGFAPLSSAYFA